MPGSQENQRRIRRRLPSKVAFLGTIGIVSGLLLILNWYHRLDSGARLTVHDGDFEILEIVDVDLFFVQPMGAGPDDGQSVDRQSVDRQSVDGRPADTKVVLNNTAFKFKLAGVKLNSALESRPSDARIFVESFVRSGRVSLRFDRYRYDVKNQIVGYLYVNDVMLNVELVANGYANPAPIQGNSVAIQNKIRKALKSRTATRSTVDSIKR